jgi:glycosyltransferase involved in cell wall biosynthesis
MRSNLLVIGNYGYVNNQIDGQTIKTRNIYKLLKSKEEYIGYVNYYDTQQFKVSWKYVLKMFIIMIKYDKIIIIPGFNFMEYIFPAVFIISKIYKISLDIIVVGGWLYKYLQVRKLHTFIVKQVGSIFPQSNILTAKLNCHLNQNNVLTLHNFRMHNHLPLHSIKKYDNELRIVFMARITREKGIDLIIGLAERIYNTIPFKNIYIDFYGPLFYKDEEEYLFDEMRKYKNLKYKGLIEPHNVYKTLSKYDVLLLPTRYPGEGFPGSILDAYIAGIPVIVSRWMNLPEFVNHEETGFIFDLDNEQSLYSFVLRLYNDRNLLDRMKNNAMKESKKYSSEFAWQVLEKRILNN